MTRILLIACTALLAFSYHGMAPHLFAAWQTDEYSHGMLIPFLSLLMAWHILVDKRPALRPSWWGSALLLLGGFFLLVAMLAAFPSAAHYGLVISLAGLCLAFLGVAATRAVAPAFIYLLFAIPLPNLLYTSLSQHLQLLSSTLGVVLLDLAGIPVYQEGNIIDLGHYKLQVVEACSGLRYLFPLVSFGFLAAYLFEGRLWMRAVILLSTIPITIGMNTLRIALIGITVTLWGPEMADGLLHEFEGWVVFMLCALLLLGEVWLLSRITPGGRFNLRLFSLPSGNAIAGTIPLRAPVIAACALSALLAGVFGTGILDERPEIVPHHPPFAAFPAALDGWRGHQRSLEPDVLQELKLSDYLLADYTRDGGKTSVNFYMAYYDRQRIGSMTHSPSHCIPGGGWQVVSKTMKPVALAGGMTIAVSRLLIRKGSVSQIVYFWFDERGRIIGDTDYAKWYLLVDSITMQRTDGALVRLVTQLSPSETEADAEKRLDGFLSAAYPVIRNFIPQGDAPQ